MILIHLSSDCLYHDLSQPAVDRHLGLVFFLVVVTSTATLNILRHL